MKKQILLGFFLAISIFATAQWTYKGLGGMITNQLTVDLDTIYASTSGGLFKKYVFSNDTNWQLVSLNGQAVINTLFLDQQECLSLVVTDAVQHKAVLYKSANRGQSLSVFVPDTVDYKYPNLSHMAKSPFSKDTIYLMDHHLRTFNGGQSWQPITSQPQSDNFICVSRENSKDIFTGGENIIFSPTIQSSNDNAQNWQAENMQNFFAGDNAVHVFEVMNGKWFAAGEGIIATKHPAQLSWTQLLNVFSDQSWGMYMYGMAFSPADSNYLYVSGNNAAVPTVGDKLRLLKSHNQGSSWDSVTYTIPQQTVYGVYDLKVQHVWGEDRVWLGGHGVFVYAQGVPTAVPGKDKGKFEAILFPNPAHDDLSIKLRGISTGKMVHVHIINALGQNIFKEEFLGPGLIQIPLQHFAAGIFQVRLITDGKQQSLRFIKD